MDVNVLEVRSIGILKLHHTTEEALTNSVIEQEVEKMRLKRRIKELEEYLNLIAFFL